MNQAIVTKLEEAEMEDSVPEENGINTVPHIMTKTERQQFTHGQEKVAASGVNVFYGEKQALKDIQLEIFEKEAAEKIKQRDGVIQPSVDARVQDLDVILKYLVKEPRNWLSC